MLARLDRGRMNSPLAFAGADGLPLVDGRGLVCR